MNNYGSENNGTYTYSGVASDAAPKPDENSTYVANNPQYTAPQYQQQYGAYNGANQFVGNQQGYQQPNGYPPYQTYDESGLFSENKLRRLNGLSARIKLGDWLKADCFMFLALIPFVGAVAAFVIYLILAFSSKTALSMKTKYQENMIFCLILIGLYIAVIIIVAILMSMGIFSGFFAELFNEATQL